MIWILLLVMSFCNCNAVIYDLEDHEYDRMPPLYAIDEYDRCLRSANGTFCVATIQLYAGKNNDLMNLIQEFSEHEVKHYDHSYINRAVCISKTCRKFIASKDLQNKADQSEILEACLNETLWEEYGLEAKVANVFYCDTMESQEKNKKAEDWFIAILFIALIMVNVVGSIYDIYFKKNISVENNVPDNSYLLCFSIPRNWKSLITHSEVDVHAEETQGFFGIKCLTTFFMPLAHVTWLVGTNIDNPQEIETSSERWQYQLVYNGMMIVQIFFVLSGFLLVRTLQVKNIKTSWKSAFLMIFSRWWRLTPANAVMLAFTATWMRHVGSGPLWNLYVSSVVTDCRKYWWLHILYINNYVPDDQACAVQTWHVAAEMQLFTLGVIVYLATINKNRNLVLTTLFLFGIAAPAIHVWLHNLDGVVLISPEFFRKFTDDTFRYLHVLGHNNIVCYIIGMATAQFVYKWKKQLAQLSKYKICRYLFWCTIPAIPCLFLTGNIFYSNGERMSLLVRMLYAATHRAVLGFIVAYLIVGLVMKFDDTVRGLLEWKGWIVPGKLCYSVYLLHLNLIHVLLGLRTQLAHVSVLYVIINHCGIVLLSAILALPFYLMVEAPTVKLLKKVMQKRLYTIESKKTI